MDITSGGAGDYDYVTTRTASRLFDISRQTIESGLRAGLIEGHKKRGPHGLEWHVSTSSLEAKGYQRREPDPEAPPDPDELRAAITKLARTAGFERHRADEAEQRLGQAFVQIARLSDELTELWQQQQPSPVPALRHRDDKLMSRYSSRGEQPTARLAQTLAEARVLSPNAARSQPVDRDEATQALEAVKAGLSEELRHAVDADVASGLTAAIGAIEFAVRRMADIGHRDPEEALATDHAYGMADRHALADTRDVMAQERDVAADARDSVPLTDGAGAPESRRTAARDRRAAAGDRTASAADRVAEADERQDHQAV